MSTTTDNQIITKAGKKYLLHIFHGRNYSPPAATVWEVCRPFGEHSTITTFDSAPGIWFGRLGTRRLPKWIDAIPAKGKDLDRRIRLCGTFRARQVRIAHAIIRRNWPESHDWTFPEEWPEAYKPEVTTNCGAAQ